MPPLKGEGDQRSWWRGSLWNLLRNVRDYTEESLSQPAAASSPKGEPEYKRASPLGVTPHGVGRCPQGRGDRSVRGEPAKLVEGFFCGIFCIMYQVTRKYPSVTYGDSSPKGEPYIQKGA